MKKFLSRLRSIFFYCGLKKEEYDSIRHLIARRNGHTLRYTSVLAILFGLVFFIINLFLNSILFPYLLIFFGSLVIYALRKLLKRKLESFSLVLCYMQMILIFIYAIILSIQPRTQAIPATSIIVFLAVLPPAIDDRPIRMTAVVAFFSGVYLAFSYYFKTPEAFSFDVMNTITFFVVGVVVYIVICARNVREINQGVRIERFHKELISSLALVIEARDENTGDHIARSQDFVRAITEKMKDSGDYPSLGDDFYEDVVQAAPMHDIGKIRITDVILNKPGKLTPEEFDKMKLHTVYGAKLIDNTIKSEDEKDYFDITRNIALYHHERYDANGYPEKIGGENIPIEARIMSLADVYDALISERVYKKAMPKEQAIEVIRDGRGTQFDPVLTDLFLDYLENEGKD